MSTEPDDLRQLMAETAAAQLKIRERLASMDKVELYRLRARLEEEATDLEAEQRLLTKALRLKKERGDDT